MKRQGLAWQGCALLCKTGLRDHDRTVGTCLWVCIAEVRRCAFGSYAESPRSTRLTHLRRQQSLEVQSVQVRQSAKVWALVTGMRAGAWLIGLLAAKLVGYWVARRRIDLLPVGVNDTILTPPEQTAFQGGFFVSGYYLTFCWSSGSSLDLLLFAKTQPRPRISCLGAILPTPRRRTVERSSEEDDDAGGGKQSIDPLIRVSVN